MAEGGISVDGGQYRFVSSDYPGTFLKTIAQFRHDAALCDVQLCVGKEVFPSHKVVLMAGSPYFYAMFVNQMIEHSKNTIQLGGVQPSIFSSILDFIYTGEIIVTEENCQELMAAADMFTVTGVITACSNFLRERLQPENCIGVYLFADVVSCGQLKKDAAAYIHKHFLTVCRSDEYFSLTKDHLLKFLQSEKLRVESEFQVFLAAIKWVMHDVTARRKCIFEVMSPVRFPIIPEKQMETYLEMMEDLSLKVALQKILQDFRFDKKTMFEKKMVKLKPYLTVPRKCARKNIYVVGGFTRLSGGRWSDARTLSTVERFDTFHQQWHSMPSINYARSSHGVGVVNGQICVVGGENDSLIFDSVETYDPVTHEWTMLPGMTTPRCGLGSCTMDNCLYSLGGWVGAEIGNTVEKYDPDSVDNKWSVIGTCPTRRFAMGLTGDAGLLYVVGGSNDMAEELGCVESFNPVTKEWITLPDLITRRAYAGVVVLEDCLYAVGGWNDADGALNTVEKFCFKKGFWEEVAPMMSARAAPSVAVVNDLVYAIGGRSYKDEFTAPSTLDTVEAYDPITNTWSDMGFMPTSRCEAGAVVL